jgi:hypothetical protein
VAVAVLVPRGWSILSLRGLENPVRSVQSIWIEVVRHLRRTKCSRHHEPSTALVLITSAIRVLGHLGNCRMCRSLSLKNGHCCSLGHVELATCLDCMTILEFLGGGTYASEGFSHNVPIPVWIAVQQEPQEPDAAVRSHVCSSLVRAMNVRDDS